MTNKPSYKEHELERLEEIKNLLAALFREKRRIYDRAYRRQKYQDMKNERS